MYEEFRKANPSFDSRMNAFVSQLLPPDLKPITLWSMEPNEAYRKTKLDKRILDFLSLSPPDLSHQSPFNYGDLMKRIGVVVRLDLEGKTGYQITDAGLDFGQPAAAAACYLVNHLASKSKERRPIYRSLQRILGLPVHRKETRYGRGFLVYKIVKLLTSKPEREFRSRDIERSIRFDPSRVSSISRELGDVRLIDFESAHKESKGKRSRDWVYEVVDKETFANLNPGEVHEEINKIRRFTLRTALTKVIEKIQSDLDAEVSVYCLANELGILSPIVRKCLAALRKLGYLDSKFNQRTRTIIKANENTLDFWYILLEPLEKAMEKLDPHAHPNFKVYDEMYTSNKRIRIRHVRNWFRIYQKEIPKSGLRKLEMRSLILTILRKRGEMKCSHILEIIRRTNPKVTRDILYCEMVHLVKDGKVRRTKRGYYIVN
jgi:transcription initiation factor IIE alpha subunit